jgi:hypothetical protein
MYTPIKEATISSTRKRGLDQDSNKETAIAHSQAANFPPSFARSLKPDEINCSGAMKRRLSPILAVFHKFSPRFRASQIVSESVLLLTHQIGFNPDGFLPVRRSVNSISEN